MKISGLIVLSVLLTTQSFAQQILPMSKLEVCNEFEIEGDWMGVGFDSVWEMSDGSLHRLMVDTNKIVAKIPISYGPFRGIATGEGFVWVPDVGAKKLYQIDPKTNAIVNTFDLPISGSEGSIAVGAGSVWIAVDNAQGKSREMKRLDVKSGKIVETIQFPDSAAGVTFENNTAYVTSPSGGEVYAIDASTNKLKERIKVGAGPRFISSGAGSVWVLNQQDGNVVRIDPKTNKVISTIDAKLPGGGGDITYGEGSIWVTMPGVPVVRINPETNKIEEEYKGYGMGDAIRVGYGSVWVSGGKLHRIKPPK